LVIATLLVDYMLKISPQDRANCDSKLALVPKTHVALMSMRTINVLLITVPS